MCAADTGQGHRKHILCLCLSLSRSLPSSPRPNRYNLLQHHTVTIFDSGPSPPNPNISKHCKTFHPHPHQQQAAEAFGTRPHCSPPTNIYTVTRPSYVQVPHHAGTLQGAAIVVPTASGPSTNQASATYSEIGITSLFSICHSRSCDMYTQHPPCVRRLHPRLKSSKQRMIGKLQRLEAA